MPRHFANRSNAKSGGVQSGECRRHKRDALMAQQRAIAKQLRAEDNSLQEIADHLNDRGFRTISGRLWLTSSVWCLINH